MEISSVRLLEAKFQNQGADRAVLLGDSLFSAFLVALDFAGSHGLHHHLMSTCVTVAPIVE